MPLSALEVDWQTMQEVQTHESKYGAKPGSPAKLVFYIETLR